MPYYPPPQSGGLTATKTTPGAIGVAGTSIQSPGGIASRTTATGAIANTETQVLGATIPANFCQAGTTFRITAAGHFVNGGSAVGATFRIRFGTTTLTGNVVTSVAPVANNTGGFRFEAIVTVRTTGAGGSVIGDCIAIGDATATVFVSSPAVSDTTATVALDTTASKILELTFISGAVGNTGTFHLAAIGVEVM